MATVKRVDIHGLTVLETKEFLTREIDTLERSVMELQIIHGYIAGQTLQQYVRKQFNHPRIQRKLVTMNQGETIFLLKIN